MSQPRVSIIIPTFNRAELLSKAITSVLRQSCLDLELLIVDDGSTDNTREVVETIARQVAIPVIYIYQENQGAPSARNHGLAVAHGEYIAFLDSDDFWLSNHLDICVSTLENDRSAGAAFTDHGITNDGKAYIRTFASVGKNSKELLYRLVTHELVLASDAIVIRRSVFHELGDFIKDLHGAEDWEMWVRIASTFKILYIPQLTVIVLQHKHNYSENPKALEKSLPLAIDAILSNARPELRTLKTKIVARSHLDLGYFYAMSGQRAQSLRQLALGLGSDWTLPKNYLFRVTMARIVFGANGLERIRAAKHRAFEKPISSL